MSFTGTLIPFQVEAVERCVRRGRMLLALHQGAGKTVVAIAAVERMAETEEGLAAVVLASSALRYQWKNAIAEFTGGCQEEGHWFGGSSCIVVDGGPQRRRELYQRIQQERPRWVILGYEQVVTDFTLVRRLPLDVLICDEITALKSTASQRSKAVKELNPRYVFGLSGTPMENGKPDEIFSIMERVDPTVLGPAAVFDRTFVVRNSNGWITGYRNLPLLHKQLGDAVVRVRRSDPGMAARMPRLIEPVLHLIPLDARCARAYSIIANDLTQYLENLGFGGRRIDVVNLYAGGGDGGDTIQGQVAARITALRMLVSDPEVLFDSAERYTRGVGGSAYVSELIDLPVFDRLPATGPKLRAATERIDTILDADDRNKIVVFAFFKTVLRKLAEAYGDEAVLFHGGMSARAKAESRRRFQHDKDVRLFVSSDAGGYGVDLPQANYLINLDLPYSKGKADQRNSRHDRVSSEHEQIHTETFLIRGSIEEFYADKLAIKGGVARAVIDGEGYDRRGRLDLNARSLLAFLSATSV